MIPCLGLSREAVSDGHTGKNSTLGKSLESCLISPPLPLWRMIFPLSFQPAGISWSSVVYDTAICCLGNKCWFIPNRAYSFTAQSRERSRWLPHLFCCVSHYPHPQLDDRNLWFSASICGPAASTHVSWGAMFLLGYDMPLCLASLFWLPANGIWPKSKKNPNLLAYFSGV